MTSYDDKTLIVDVETTGLSPFDCRLTCISVVFDGKITSFMNVNEKKMLQEFWNFVSSHKIERLCAYNAPFDVSFLRTRSLINSVRVVSFHKWDGVVDLMKVTLFGNSMKFAKQQDLCDKLGFDGVKYHLNGKDMPGLWTDGRFDEIREHCEDDCYQLYRIYVRCKDCNLI